MLEKRAVRNEEGGSWYKKRKAHSQCKRVMRILIHKDGCLIFEGGWGGWREKDFCSVVYTDLYRGLV